MTGIVGTLKPDLPGCSEGQHQAATYNCWMDQTWCWCGRMRWPGYRETQHAIARYDSVGRGLVTA